APPPPPEPEEIKTHPWREKLREILGKYGYFPTDELSKSFVYALKTLHAFVGGREFRYHTPWYLMVGAEDTGKTSVLQSLGLDLPIGKPHFGEAESQKYLLDWWFFNHGTVLDVDGALFH